MFLDDAMAAAAAAAGVRMELLPASCLEAVVSGLDPPPPFARAVARGSGPARVIAEIKRMSPSAGTIRRRAPVEDIAGAYEGAGAAAVSVLTCGYMFGGCVADLEDARAACALPLLRKDFISAEYQVLEARAFGASAVLLVAEALSGSRLAALAAYARDLGLEALIEAHTRAGIEKAVSADAAVFGINNRDLETLEVEVSTTARLLPHVPAGAVVVSESGIRSPAAARRVAETGVDALLVGEELMRAPEPGRRLREFIEALEPAAGASDGPEAEAGSGRGALAIRAAGEVEREESEGEVCGSCG